MSFVSDLCEKVACFYMCLQIKYVFIRTFVENLRIYMKLSDLSLQASQITYILSWL